MYHELGNNIKTKSGALRNRVVVVWRYTQVSTRAAHQCSYSLVRISIWIEGQGRMEL